MALNLKSKKTQVLLRLLELCQESGNFRFHNDQVKDIARQVRFGNPFDATKLDNLDLLPQELLDLDLAVIHLGKGFHAFVKGTRYVYHSFEEIREQTRLGISQKLVEWLQLQRK